MCFDKMQTTDIVSKYFISEYYTSLHKNTNEMTHFYDKDSVISFTIDQQHSKVVKSVEQIPALFQEYSLQNCSVNLDNGHVSVLPIENGGMHILVSGQICLNDERERSFSQTFLLDKKTSPAGDFYVIKHDMLHLMELPEMTQEIVEEIVEEVPVESAKVADAAEEPTTESVKPAEEPAMPPEPAQPVPSFIPAFSSEPVEEKPAEPVEEKPAEPVVEEKPVEEKPVEAAQPVEAAEATEPVAEKPAEEKPAEEKPTEVTKPAEEKKEAEPVPEPPKKKEEEKKERKPRSYNGLFPHSRRPANRRVPERKPEEKKEEEFVVVKSRFTKKSSTCGSTVRVIFHSDSVNEEALLQLFKSEGTIVEVKVIAASKYAFIDFMEETAAASVVQKAKEEPFRLGNDTLTVEVKKGGNQRPRHGGKRD